VDASAGFETRKRIERGKDFAQNVN